MSEEQKQNQKNQRLEVFAIAFSAEDAIQPSLVPGVPDELESPHDFEEAVEAAGYGLFNYLILLGVMLAGFANFFDTTTMSYIIPSAECDLQLTLFQKGMLNAAIYAGMISSAFVWGFLSDTRGRRRILMCGFLADFVCNILSSTSQSFKVMVAFKFMSGCLISGPLVISIAYLAEFHGTKYRSRAMLWARLAPSIANILLPGLAWSILPQSWSFTLFDGAFVYNSWRIFILICSTPALLGFLALFCFPESPRFLMSQGRNDEALKVFQRMYAMNTGNQPENFPVKSLCQEGQKKQIERSASRRSMSLWDKTRSGFAQIKPLFKNPYLGQFLLVTTIQFGGLLSLNTLRLWIPQLSTLMENFDYEHRDPSLGPPTLCDMLSPAISSNVTASGGFNSTSTDTCVVAPVHSKVYINSMIIAATTVLGYTIAGNVIHLVGAKRLLLISYATPAVCSFVLNWSPNSDVTLAIIAIYMAFTSVTITVVMNVIVELMPTSLRTTASSLNMCAGRCGAMIGNLLFPILLSAGCTVPFIFVGGFLLVSLVLSIFIPKPPAKLM